MNAYDPGYFWAVISSFLLLTVILSFCIGKFGVAYVERQKDAHYSYFYPMIMTYIFVGFVPILTTSAYFDINGYLVAGSILGGFLASTMSLLLGIVLEKRKVKNLKKQQSNEEESPAV